jgi:signal transduction histidine kinase
MMAASNLRLGVVFVFFVYGLAFFTMGIALVLEAGRSPRLAERRVLWPLAVFGVMHGAHEWMEILLLQGIWLGLSFPEGLSWFRIGWLAASFIPLVLFGLILLLPENWPGWPTIAITLGFVVAYGLTILINFQIDPDHVLGRVDAWSRYLLAIPGGLLAGNGLRRRAFAMKAAGRTPLTRLFLWAALGFGLYGLTQILVSPIDMFPANWLNNQVFQDLFGIPVQFLRAGAAVLITINLVRAIIFVEREREEQLVAAQQARLEALEQVHKEMEEREALRRELLRHTVIAQEEERARIARELHDETAQFLTVLSLTAATLRNSLQERVDAVALLDRLQTMSRQMSQGIYRMVHDLRPAQLDDLGLVAALKYLIDNERKNAGLEISLDIQGQKERLDPLVETVLFRVAQEALNNVARHAGCDRAKVRLCYQADQVSLLVEDDGVGFAMNGKRAHKRGWGLAGMRERAESVGGWLNLHSQPGKGTQVEIVVPIAINNAEKTEEVYNGPNPLDAG